MIKQSTTAGFFDIQSEKSFVKAIIVKEFFAVYFSIINNAKFSDDIYYIDLFSGPGIYKDGKKSTPLMLLDTVEGFRSDDIRNKLHLIFNDENPEYYNSLKKQIEQHSVYPRLKHKPLITNQRASNVNLSPYLSGNKPKFSFIDPWGYIDVSSDQIGELVKSIGSDCVLFFNANRILQDLCKDTSQEHMLKIFGKKLKDAIDVQKNGAFSQQTKCKRFLSLFSENLYNTHFAPLKKQNYRLFVLPFAVEQDDVDKTSHYIVFISKNHKAVCEMKKIMLKHSTSNNASLEFNSKEQYAISMFSRADDICQEIISDLKSMFQACPTLKQQYNSLDKWLEHLDAYKMSTNYEVTPYSLDEVKTCIKKLDDEGFIVIEETVKKIRSRITNDRKFRFEEGFGV